MNLADALTPLLASISASLAVTALISSFLSATRRRSRIDADVKRLAASLNEPSLGEDLDALGSYLFNTVGQVRVSDYVQDATVRTEVRKALRTVRQILGPEPTGPVIEPPSTTMPEPRAAGGELARALDEVAAGEIWNGLARVRRYTEVLLRNGLRSDSTRGVRALTRQAVSEGLIDPIQGQALEYSAQVANRAVHGMEVSESEALEAITAAEFGLAGLI